MYTFDELDITGFRGEPLDNTLFLLDDKSDKLAIVFPGFGYTSQMPVVYYTIRALLSSGKNVLSVDYHYNRKVDFRRASSEDRLRWVEADLMGVMEAVSNEGRFEITTLAGKSLGTRTIALLLQAHPDLASCHIIWLTPLLGDPLLMSQIAEHSPKSLFVIGTNDSLYDEETLNTVGTQTGGNVLVIEGGDHGLEVKDDTLSSVKAIQDMVAAIEVFLS